MENLRLDSWFFRKGQVIETFRGKGIYQAAIDDATRKLNEGRWVRPGWEGRRREATFAHVLFPCLVWLGGMQIHIFPEGKIKQEALLELRRFKWGISRMLMEAKRTPLIIPVWIQGPFLLPLPLPVSPHLITPSIPQVSNKSCTNLAPSPASCPAPEKK